MSRTAALQKEALGEVSAGISSTQATVPSLDCNSLQGEGQRLKSHCCGSATVVASHASRFHARYLHAIRGQGQISECKE
jgi:hypothetical protein